MKRLKRLKKNEGLELCLREGFVSPTGHLLGGWMSLLRELCLREGFVSPTASSLCEPGGSRSGNYACGRAWYFRQRPSRRTDPAASPPSPAMPAKGLRTFDV